MGQVTVTLNGRTYRLRCGDGEEGRLSELGEILGQRIENLAIQFGQFGDERLLLMAALLITDEMLDFKTRLDAVTEAHGIGAEACADETLLLAADAGQPLNAVTSPPVPVEMPEAAVATAPPVVEPPPETAPSRPRPALRRSSLEARLAQARVGAPTKTGT